MKGVLTSLATQNNTTSIVYPNLSKLGQICLVLPIGTADCERGFSTMKRIKTRLRSQMSNITLNHCMRISMEGEAFDKFDFDSAVDSWSRLKNKRIVWIHAHWQKLYIYIYIYKTCFFCWFFDLFCIIVYLATLKYLVYYLTDITTDNEECERENGKITALLFFFWGHPWSVERAIYPVQYICFWRVTWLAAMRTWLAQGAKHLELRIDSIDSEAFFTIFMLDSL